MKAANKGERRGANNGEWLAAQRVKKEAEVEEAIGRLGPSTSAELGHGRRGEPPPSDGSRPEDVPALCTAWEGMPGFPPFPRERLFRRGAGYWIDSADGRKVLRGRPLTGWPVRRTDIRDVFDPRPVGFAHRRDPYRPGSLARHRRILKGWAENEPENPLPVARLENLDQIEEPERSERQVRELASTRVLAPLLSIPYPSAFPAPCGRA